MIELITTSLFVLSSIYGAPTVALAADTMAATSTTPTIAISDKQINNDKLLTKSQLELKQKVQEYFKDYPILVSIAGCESQFRQFDANGNTLKGKINKGDLGVMQINKYYHEDKARELGYDLNTTEGNMAYAKYLYEKEGSKPWISSSKCWIQADIADQNNNAQSNIALPAK